MITNNAEALEGLRNALAQLHDVNVYYAGTDSESQWCTSVALDWVRTALHYGEQAALTDVLARMHAADVDPSLEHCDYCGNELETSQIGLCDDCQSLEANLRAAKAMGFQPSDHTDCGPLCPLHGDPRETSISPSVLSDTGQAH
jgi:hypothetical protein